MGGLMVRERADVSDKKLYGLIALAVLMSAGHHVDHLIRGNNVGWPINSEVKRSMTTAMLDRVRRRT